MKLKISKANEEITTIIVNEDGKEENFTNLAMIDYLYNNKDKTVELEFDNQFKEEEQNKIKSLFKKIEDIVKASVENE